MAAAVMAVSPTPTPANTVGAAVKVLVAAEKRHLGVLPGTAMVIRGDELITDQEFVEANDAIEIRNVISGG